MSGCTVAATSDPLQAVRIGSEQQFDLVVLDIRMPHLDGIEVLQRIRGAGHREIIMLTGWIDDDLDAKARREGAADVMRKPVDLDKLLARIDRLRGGG